MIDIDVTSYYFIDKVTALAIYEKNDISLVKLLRSKNVKAFNNRQEIFITETIYSSLKIDDYIKESILILINNLEQQTLILKKS
jgi:uncharacterized protein YaiI (UPF0178 family)